MSRPLFALRQSSPLASRPSAARRQGPSSPPKLESIVIFVAKQPREARETASINYITSRFLANSRFEGVSFFILFGQMCRANVQDVALDMERNKAADKQKCQK